MSTSLTSTNFLQVLENNLENISVHVKNNTNLVKISGIHDENFQLLEKSILTPSIEVILAFL